MNTTKENPMDKPYAAVAQTLTQGIGAGLMYPASEANANQAAPLEHALGGLRESISCVETVLSVLARRLEPVLRIAPEVAQELSPSRPLRGTSPVLEELTSYEERLRRVEREANTLLQRLEV